MPAARAGALRRRRIKVLPAFSKAAVGKAEPYDLALKAKRSFAEKAMQAQARTRLKGDRAPGRTVSTVPSDGFWETDQALVYGLRPVRCVQHKDPIPQLEKVFGCSM